jgi:hypothetical protein
VYQVRQDLPERLDQRGLLDLPGPLVHQVLLVLQELPEPLVKQAPQALQVPLVPQALLEQMEPQVLPELPEPLVLLDLVFITSLTPLQHHLTQTVIDGMIPQRDWNLFG